MNSIGINPGEIVVAVDGSRDSLRAVRWAAVQAALEHRILALVNVHADEALGVPSQVLGEAAATAAAVRSAVETRCISVAGDPRRVLSGLSVSSHLIVLGSRGRGPVRSRLLGSVSAGVAEQARSPVVVVRPDRPGVLKDGVMVAAEATAESIPVVEFAFRQASLRQLPLTVVHCVFDVAAVVTGVSATAVNLPDLTEHRLLLAESLAGLVEEYPDVHLTTHVARGLVEDYLAARPRPWDLIVVGRHPVHGILRSGSTTALGVLEHADSPVAVVPQR